MIDDIYSPLSLLRERQLVEDRGRLVGLAGSCSTFATWLDGRAMTLWVPMSSEAMRGAKQVVRQPHRRRIEHYVREIVRLPYREEEECYAK